MTLSICKTWQHEDLMGQGVLMEELTGLKKNCIVRWPLERS